MISGNTDLVTLDLQCGFTYDVQWNGTTASYIVTDVNAQSSFGVLGLATDSTNYTGEFPRTSTALDLSIPINSREAVSAPQVEGFATRGPQFEFSAEMAIRFPQDWGNVIQDLVSHVYQGSVVARIGLYDFTAKAYLPAEQFSLFFELSTFLEPFAVSSVRYLGNISHYSYYRVFISGILKKIPPITISVGCGRFQQKNPSYHMTCFCDLNIAGAFLGTAVSVEAELKQRPSLRPESTPTVGGRTTPCESTCPCRAISHGGRPCLLDSSFVLV